MRSSAFLSLLAAVPTAFAQVPTQPPLANTTALPVHFGLVLFPHFQALDVFGPLDVLNTLAMIYKNTTSMHLSILSRTMAPVSTSMGEKKQHRMRRMGQGMQQGGGGGGGFGQSVLPTNTFKEVLENGGKCPPQAAGHGKWRKRHGGHPEHEGNDPEGKKIMNPEQNSSGAIDVLIVPGGGGTRKDMTEEIEFVKQMYPKVKYIISICTGASILARAGILDGKKATTNKKAWQWAVSTGPNVNWQPAARWVEDGNIWTSSGISAGTDVTYAWLDKVFGVDASNYIAAVSEYERWTEAARDPFADMWQAGKGSNGTTPATPPTTPAAEAPAAPPATPPAAGTPAAGSPAAGTPPAAGSAPATPPTKQY